MDSVERGEYNDILLNCSEAELDRRLAEFKKERNQEEFKLYPNMLYIRDCNEAIDMIFMELARRSGLTPSTEEA